MPSVWSIFRGGGVLVFSGIDGTVTFYIKPTTTTEVTFEACWGTSTYYAAYIESGDTEEMYVTAGETVALSPDVTAQAAKLTAGTTATTTEGTTVGTTTGTTVTITTTTTVPTTTVVSETTQTTATTTAVAD